MNLYFISGLGADERVFARLQLPDEIIIHHIAWPKLSPGETLFSYRDKIISCIDTSQKFGIVGLSFGGIIATEIAKTIKPEFTVLLSSVTTKTELPLLYRILGQIGVNKLIPSVLLNRIYPFTYWFFGVKEKDDKRLLRSIIHATSPAFLRWALNEILNWKNVTRPYGIFHIHGSIDRLFRLNKVKPDMIIDGAGHLMVHTHARLISQAITKVLKSS